MSDQPTILFVEHVLWEPGEEWTAALEHLASRFARVSALDIAAITASGPLHAQLDALAEWAAAADVDLDRELGRWFDEHLSMHVRPAPAVTRGVRALAAETPIDVASALPPRAAESITRHAGCWRSVTHLHAPIRNAESLAQLVEQLAPGAVIAGTSTPVPEGVTRASLGAPIT